MVPSAFVRLEALPRLASGKLDRGALPEPAGVGRELEEAFVAPRTPVEKLLAGIWAELLGAAEVGIHDDFFELGGHSLLATQVISRLREACQVELPLRSLFEHPTIAGLALAVSESQGEEKDKRDGSLLSSRADPITRINRRSAGQLLAQLDQFSDEEVDSLLSDALAGRKINQRP
jgi:acyl carrier protein